MRLPDLSKTVGRMAFFAFINVFIFHSLDFILSLEVRNQFDSESESKLN